MKYQSLNGEWKYRIGKGKWQTKDVPFSSLAVGHSECSRVFDLNDNSERIFLKFDRITYRADVYLNGVKLGEMGPYSEYLFDITDIVRGRENTLTVCLEDLALPFGPSAGWENYGGIIGDVGIVYRKNSFIDNVYFHTSLKNEYSDADYTVEITLGGNKKGSCKVTLEDENGVVDFFESIDKTIVREAKNVELWSPDNPELYKLTVSLEDDGVLLDTYTASVGFCEFKCNRHRFLLNGKEIYLHGVCRHEMVADYGHTVPEEKIEEDMKNIKALGCNYVRLVHYPHSKKTLEIADKIGLLVSEEPGLWWSDTADPRVSEACLEVLKRTVIRDRNHPSIAFWLCFNECKFTEEFLKSAAKVCRENDGTRLVSGANCMTDDDTLVYYNRCGFDFYTMHPYHETLERSYNSARKLNDKPLMFTEWGGYYVYDNPKLLSDFIKAYYRLYENNSDDGALAGASFWYYRELNDFDRGGDACVDGALKESLVDRYGNPTPIYKAFAEALVAAKKQTAYDELYEYRQTAPFENKKPLKCTSESDYSAFLDEAKKITLPSIELSRTRKVEKGPALMREEVPGIRKTPWVVMSDKDIIFAGEGETDTLTVLGAVSAPAGYPVAGNYGEEAVKVMVTFTDDSTFDYIMKNGVDFTTVFTTVSSSRIIPIAEKATEFARFSYDKNFENYIINRLDIKLGEKKGVKSISFASLDDKYNLLIYGVYM